MIKAEKWVPGIVIKVVPSSGGTERVFVYVQKNFLSDELGNKYWFNEALFPFAQVGYIIFVNLDEKPNINISYEITEVISK